MPENTIQISSDIQIYFTDRLLDQYNWYDKKAGMYKSKYYTSKFSILAISALIPFLTAYADSLVVIKILVGLMGVAIAVISGMLLLFKYHENWINYRRTAEVLKTEIYNFQARIGAYDNTSEENEKQLFKILTNRVEGILSAESENWINYSKEKTQETTSKP